MVKMDLHAQDGPEDGLGRSRWICMVNMDLYGQDVPKMDLHGRDEL